MYITACGDTQFNVNSFARKSVFPRTRICTVLSELPHEGIHKSMCKSAHGEIRFSTCRYSMYLHDPLVDLPRPSAEDPPLEFLPSGAENPPLDLSRPGAEQIFLLYIEEKFSALGRGESTFGSIAPGRGTDFHLYIEEKFFCARTRKIHLWIYHARARNGFFFSL